MMDPNLFVTMGRELRQLRDMHPDDGYLHHVANVMIGQMRNYEQEQDPAERAAIERSYMANLKWLVEWKRRKLAIVG